MASIQDVTASSNGRVDEDVARGPMIHDAEGREVPRPSDYVEQGVNSPFYAIPIEYNNALYPRIQALRTYEKMKRNDAQVRLSLRVCKFPVLGADWYVEPASSEQDDKDVAEFIEYNLFTFMTSTWFDVLTHILSFLDYGFSCIEEVFTEAAWRPDRAASNSRNYTMLRKLAPRPAVTLDRFEYDESGGPVGMWHKKADPNQQYQVLEDDPVLIPIDKMVIFTYDKEGGNLEGQSILRTAFQHWYYKNNLYKIDAIQKERHGIGIPDIILPPGYDDSDLKYAKDMARNLRTNEQAHIVRPMGWEVGFAKPEGQLTNALESAEHHDLMIVRNVLAQFINGTSSAGTTGSRSNMATSFDMLLKSLRQIGAMVCSGLNQHLIPQLVDYNFTVQRYPTLKVRGIGESRDQQMLAAAIRNLVSENVISVDDDFEEYIRQLFDWPTNWDKASVRVNEQNLKPFVAPEQIALARAGLLPAGGGGGNFGTASAGALKATVAKADHGPPPQPGAPASGRAQTRGPTTGTVGKATTEG